MIQKWKKLSEEVLHQNPWWIYKHDTYEKTDGQTGDYYYGECRGNAMIIPVLPDGRFVMIHAYRYIRNEESIEFPCGGIEKGNTPEETAHKELLEETGYTIDELIPVGTFQGLNGVFENECHVFVAHVSERQAQHLESTEQIEVVFCTSSEIEDLLSQGKIWDGQSLASWALAQRFFPQ